MKSLPRFTNPTTLARFVIPALVLSLAASGPAFAGTISSSDTFYVLVQTLLSWINGGLGVALALASVLIGAGVGVVKGSPIAMVSGLAIAALLHWMPDIIINLMTSGAVLR
jgi:conjugal transfer pilus assembly protein TraA